MLGAIVGVGLHQGVVEGGAMICELIIHPVKGEVVGTMVRTVDPPTIRKNVSEGTLLAKLAVTLVVSPSALELPLP